MNHKNEIIEFRKSQPSDVDQLIIFLSKVAIETNFTTLSKNGVPTKEKLKLKINEYIENPLQLHISAFQGSSVVGQLSFRPLYQDCLPLLYKGTFGLAVLKIFWGSGVAQALMSIMEEHAKLNGFSEIEASVKELNSRGLRFYQKMGYEIYDCNLSEFLNGQSPEEKEFIIKKKLESFK